LAALLAGRGRPESARALLQPVFEQFAEGSDTASPPIHRKNTPHASIIGEAGDLGHNRRGRSVAAKVYDMV
jgi:hypothetical protein